MGPTHHVMGSSWWLAGVLAANVAGAGINPVVAAAGAVVAPVFAAGWLSPDADVSWLSHLGHRRATHRPDTTAVYLTLASVIIWLVAIPLAPAGTHWLALAPVTGWWSHLIGDAIFGKIPISKRIVASGWFGLGLDTDGLIERGTVRLKTRTATGLHKTRRVLPFAPTTALLSALTVVLLGLIVLQSVSAQAGGA